MSAVIRGDLSSPRKKGKESREYLVAHRFVYLHFPLIASLPPPVSHSNIVDGGINGN